MPPRFQRAPDVLHSMVDGDVVALSVDRGECVSMPGVTASIWAYLESPKTLEELTELTLADYDVDEDVCRQDIADLLSDLESAGMVSRA